MPDPDQLPPERDRLLRKLTSIADLSDADKQALLSLPMRVEALPADTDIVRDGDRPSESCLVLDGFVCRYKLLPDGRQQIMSFTRRATSRTCNRFTSGSWTTAWAR